MKFSGLNRPCISDPFPKGSEIIEEEERKTVRSRKNRHLWQNSIYWAGHEHTEAGTVCKIPAQDQVDSNPSVDRGGSHELPPLTEELLAVRVSFLQGYSPKEATDTVVSGPTLTNIQAAHSGSKKGKGC